MFCSGKAATFLLASLIDLTIISIAFYDVNNANHESNDNWILERNKGKATSNVLGKSKLGRPDSQKSGRSKSNREQGASKEKLLMNESG